MLPQQNGYKTVIPTNRGTKVTETGPASCVLVVTHKPLLPWGSDQFSVTHLCMTEVRIVSQRLEPSFCLVCIYWQAPLVHHTPSPSSSCHLALCLLYGEEGGMPHLLTTRPDNEILPGTRQPAWLHFNAFTFFL